MPPSIRETLELIIHTDGTQTLRTFKEIGEAAERDLGKAEGGAARLGGRMQTAGVGMIAFGAVALEGMHMAVEAFEQAEAANLKLENSIANSPQEMAGAFSAFDDLAKKLQQTTIYSDEATKSMMAYLIQTGRTKDEVINLTPHIQDLASKMGIDLDTAAKTVTLALNGKKKGLEAMIGPLDAATYGTDRYAAVMQGLGHVEGFAEEQGKTFSGQLAIMQNNLHDVAEGVGKGAVDAFSNLLKGVSAVTGALDKLSPGTESMIGEWATYGGVALVVLGAFNLIAGTVLKAATTLGIKSAATVVDTAVTEANTTAELENAAAHEAAGLAMIPVVGAIAAVGAALYFGTQHAEEFTWTIKNSGDAVKAFANASASDLDTVTQGARLTGTSMYDMGKKLVEQSIPAAQAWADALDRTGKSSTDVRRAIADHNRELEAQKHDQAEAAAAADGMTVATKEQMKAEDEAAKAVANYTSFIDQLASAMDKTYQATTSAIKLHSSYEASLDDLTQSLRDNGTTLDDSTDKGRKNIDSVLKMGDSIAKLIEKRFQETHSVKDATDAGKLYTLNLENQLRAAGYNEEQISQMIDTMNLTPDKIDTIFSNNAVEQQIVVGKYLAQINDIPEDAKTMIESEIAQGDYDKVNQQLNDLAAGRAVTFYPVAGAGDGPTLIISTPGSYTPRAGGGPVSAMRPYLIGERGPELFVPSTSGQVVPNGELAALAGGSSQPIVIHVQAPDPLGAAFATTQALRAQEFLSRR